MAGHKYFPLSARRRGEDDPDFHFQKRHYETIAAVLAETRPHDDGERGLYLDQHAQWETGVKAFAKALHADRPSGEFNIARFIEACHVRDKVGE